MTSSIDRGRKAIRAEEMWEAHQARLIDFRVRADQRTVDEKVEHERFIQREFFSPVFARHRSASSCSDSSSPAVSDCSNYVTFTGIEPDDIDEVHLAHQKSEEEALELMYQARQRHSMHLLMRRAADDEKIAQNDELEPDYFEPVIIKRRNYEQASVQTLIQQWDDSPAKGAHHDTGVSSDRS